MQLVTSAPSLSKRTGCVNKFASCIGITKNKTITEWTIDQLDIRPYQHVLEIGYASGYTLQEVARKLKIGFLAGIDESIMRYQQAYRRNKKLIQDQLLQLHIGGIHELPYPHHYFHTIYANNIVSAGREIQYALIQLINLLKSGGRMVMVLQTATGANEKTANHLGEEMKQHYLHAGFRNIQFETHDMGVAVIGYKE